MMEFRNCRSANVATLLWLNALVAVACSKPSGSTSGELPPVSAPDMPSSSSTTGAAGEHAAGSGSPSAANNGRSSVANASPSTAGNAATEPSKVTSIARSDSSGLGSAGQSGSPDVSSAGAAASETAAATPCAELTGEPSSGPGTGYPGGRWSVPDATFATFVQENVQIMMDDGVALVADVSYPADLQTRQRAQQKFPVILTQNPYGAGTFGADYGSIFVTHGYIFASVDVRGTGRSGGMGDMFSPREARDGAALVAWAAALEGSDGQVGLQGCSQLGINQLETVSQLGPDSPVKAMIPACASGDFYRDTAFDNGIPTIVGNLLADPDATNGGDMAYYREYWKTRDRLARAPAMAATKIPMLFWSGWHEPGSLGSLELYAALQNLSAGRPVNTQITSEQEVSGRYQVILGDWAHGGGLDLGIQLQWYDTWIKGLDTGLPTDTKTPLHLAELGGSKRWINSRCYPLVEHYTPLFFANGGKLAMAADTDAGQDMLTWSSSATTASQLEYVSDALAEGALLAGPIAAQIHLSSSNANALLVIDVFDVAPNAQRTQLSHASVLGSLRRQDPEKSWSDQAGLRLPKRPYLTLDEDQPLTPNQSTLLEVPLWPTLWSVEPMHKLLVRITTQADSNACADPLGVPVGCYPSNPMLESLRGGTYALQRGGQAASLISLPWVKRGAYATAASAVSKTAGVMASSPDARPLPTDW